MFGLIKKIATAAKPLVKPTLGAAGTVGAALAGVIDPETAQTIGVAVYVWWITAK